MRTYRDWLTAALTAVTLIGAPIANAFATEQRLNLVIGHATTIALEENPSTGYQWQIDFSESSNVSIVHVTDNGFTQAPAGDHPLVGAPGVHSWTIDATASGSATLVFVYRREWEMVPVRRHVVTIETPPS